MKKNRGAVYLVLLLVMSGVFIILATAIMGLAFANLKLARHNETMVSSLSVAEAGVNYYLWHLSHAPLDFCDGHPTGSVECPATLPASGFYGPYHHDFTAPGDNTKVLGSFDIYITPPPTGGKIYDIKAVGTAKNTTLSRTVRAGIGIPSFAAYAVLGNNNLFFEQYEKTDGPVHSNGGIRYDPVDANDTISSSKARYVPSYTWGGLNCHPVGSANCDEENGVWSPIGGGPTSFWQFPTPTIDFNQVAVDLNTLKTAAQTSDGIYLNTAGAAGGIGYALTLKANNTIDIYKVTAETYRDGITKTLIQANRAAPANGILYSEKPLWVDGTWNDQITIATSATRIQRTSQDTTNISITINGNLKYATPRDDGTKKIGLVGKGTILVPVYLYIPDNLEIDAAMLSKEGYVWVDFDWNYHPVRANLTIYGSVASDDGSTFVWRQPPNPPIGGFNHVDQIYDRNLTINPPPKFPTTGSFQVLTWREE